MEKNFNEGFKSESKKYKEEKMEKIANTNRTKNNKRRRIMKHAAKITLFGMLLALMLVFGLTQAASAAQMGTLPDVNITNQASVDYEVGAVAQTQIDSNTDDFEVDRLLDIDVSESGGTTTGVSPKEQDTVTTFIVTNQGNDTIDALVAAVNRVDTTADPHGGNADSFDLTGLSVFVESGANAGYLAAEDTGTYIDNLASGDPITVYVVGDIPDALADNVVSVVTLTATIAVVSGSQGSPGAAETEDGDGNDDAVVENVFGDGTGATDADDDGKDSDSDSYTVNMADLTITKSSTVYWDPANLLVSPYPIPGAIITYTITVSNGAGAATADNVIITDTVDTTNVTIETQYAPDPTCNAGEGIYLNGTTCQTNANDGDNAEFIGSTLTADLGSIAAGASKTVSYQVKIN